MSGITTHILDTSRGRPAQGVPVALDLRDDESWTPVGSGATDADGRLKTLMEGQALQAGTYRLTFDTATYFASKDAHGFYPAVQIQFAVRATEEHYHVPLLLNPFGYSTYRGS